MMNLPHYLKKIRQQGHLFFTIDQLITDLNISKRAALSAISRIKKQGDIISPAKGLYIIVPPERQPYGSIAAQELVPILMNYLHADYYVSLLSAAELYGASHQKPQRFQIISNKRIKHPLIFGHIVIEPIFKKSLLNLPLRNFTVASGYLKVASPELVVFDLLHYPTRSGGLNHIATVLTELIENIDSKKLMYLAEQVGEKAWLQRLGFMLEQLDLQRKSTLALIETLHNYLQNKSLFFVSLAAELPTAGYPRIKRWHIIENTTLESDV